jgi:hypothetical protein
MVHDKGVYTVYLPSPPIFIETKKIYKKDNLLDKRKSKIILSVFSFFGDGIGIL